MFGGKAFFVKYLNLYKKMLEKIWGVYIKLALSHGAGQVRGLVLSVRVGSVVGSCALSSGVLHPLLLCGPQPQTSPVVGAGWGSGAGGWHICLRSLLNTSLLTAVGYRHVPFARGALKRVTAATASGCAPLLLLRQDEPAGIRELLPIRTPGYSAEASR